MNRCHEDGCVGALVESREQHHYTESGLDNIWLDGTLISRCDRCGVEYVTIECIGPLHDAIDKLRERDAGRKDLRYYARRTKQEPWAIDTWRRLTSDERQHIGGFGVAVPDFLPMEEIDG